MIYLACADIRLDDATTVQIVRRNTTADLIEAYFNYIAEDPGMAESEGTCSCKLFPM